MYHLFVCSYRRCGPKKEIPRGSSYCHFNTLDYLTPHTAKAVGFLEVYL